MHILTGDVKQQDDEIASVFQRLQLQFGENNVLGILASRDEHEESFYVEPEPRFTIKYIFIAENKSIFHLYEPPLLTVLTEALNETFSLTNHLSVVANETETFFSLRVQFNVSEPSEVDVSLF